MFLRLSFVREVLSREKASGKDTKRSCNHALIPNKENFRNELRDECLHSRAEQNQHICFGNQHIAGIGVKSISLVLVTHIDSLWIWK